MATLGGSENIYLPVVQRIYIYTGSIWTKPKLKHFRHPRQHRIALEIPDRHTTSNQHKATNSSSDGTANDSRVVFLGRYCLAHDGWQDGCSTRGGGGDVGPQTYTVTIAGEARRATSTSSTTRHPLGAAT